MSAPAWHARLQRHPRRVLAAIGLLVLALGAAAPFTRWDANPELLTLSGSRELADYREFLARFGSDALIVIGFEDASLLEPEGLARVRTLTDRLWDIPGVASVVSLDTLTRVDVGPFGPFARSVVPDSLADAPTPAVLRDRIRALPMARDTLLDAIGTTTTIVVRPEGSSLDAESRRTQHHVLEAVRGVLAHPDFASLEFHLAGAPVFNDELERLNSRDAERFTPLTLALVTGFLAIALRSWVGVGLALACVLGALAVVRGAMTLLDVPLNTTTSLLPPLLMVVTVSVCVHVLARYQRERAAGASAEQAVAETERRVLLPAALTALTTAAGFASLLASQIPSVRSFGIFAALGVGTSFLLGAIALPAALRLLQPEAYGSPGPDRVDRALARLRAIAWARAGLVLAVTLASVCVAGIGATHLRVATHDGEFFPPNHALNRAYRFIESRLAGVTPLEVVVEARWPRGIRSAESIEAMRRLQDLLAEQPETVRGVSIVDWIDEARDAIEPAAERHRTLDDASVERAAFVLQATSGDDLPYWVQDDWGLARIASRSVGLNSEQNDELLGRLERLGAERLGPNAPVRARFTGLVPVFARMEEVLLDSQVASFSLAFGAVFVVFLALFRSARAAGVALIPNLVPIMLMLGGMGFLGIPLDVVTVMVASVNLGIVVDDTIHLLHAVRAGVGEGLTPERAVERAVAQVGRAVVFTSLVLGCGFFVLLMSDFRPTARFGGLTGSTMLAALAADLVLLPALVRVARPFPQPEAGRLAVEEAA